MGEAMITRRGGGGGKLNALVEQYQVAAGGSVSANGFVKFVDDLSAHQASPYNFPDVSACALSDTLVLIAYSRKNSAYYFCGAIAFSDESVMIGTRTQLRQKSGGSSAIYGYTKCIALDATTALVFYCGVTSSVKWGYSLVSVSADKTITVLQAYGNLADLTISEFSANDPTGWSVRGINNNEFLVIENDGTNGYIRARVYTYGSASVNTTAKRYNSLKLAYASTATEGLVVAKLATGKYIAIRPYSAGTYPNYTYYRDAYIITDSGTTLSISAASVIMSQNTAISAMCDAVAVADNKVLLVYCPGGNASGGGYLCGRLLTINGTSVTAANETQLTTNKYIWNVPSNDDLRYYYNRVISEQFGGWFSTQSGPQLILHPNVASPTYALQFAVSGDVITTLSEDVLIAQDTSQDSTMPVFCATAQTSDGKRLVYTTVSSKLTGTMLSTAVDAATSGTVDGVAKDNALAGETVDVYRPA